MKIDMTLLSLALILAAPGAGVALGATLSPALGTAVSPERARPAPKIQDDPTAAEILDAMDRNLTFQTRTARVKMIVEGRRTREYEMVTYGRGAEDSAIEYLSPARERGTRMLKLADELWIYMPTVDRVQKISGHMLREGMMGSDVSYEDLMTSRELQDDYDARILGEEGLDGADTWQLELTAKDEAVSYPRRVMWIDKESFIPLKQELYALSGMLLKTWTMGDVEAFEDGRLFPTSMVIQDHVRPGSSTRMEFSDIRFGIELEQEVFSLRWLERR
jgi:outer membrane lipoprotein-sorting protein